MNTVFLQYVTKPSAEYVDHMGNDADIVKAARMSFSDYDQDLSDKGILSLLNYLARGMKDVDWLALVEKIQKGSFDRDEALALLKTIRKQKTHWTPFAHTTIKLKCAAPVPIRTQAFKHKTGLVENEESRRYITTTPDIYLPDFKYRPEASIKQGSGKEHALNEQWQNVYMDSVHRAVQVYEDMLADNVCPEQARFVLPQGAIVNWVWTGNLFAFANYVSSRLDPHAQADGYPLAHDIDQICRRLFPMAWSVLIDQ